MKTVMLAGAFLLAIATPATSQTTPSTTNGIPNTPLSTSTAPSTGPRAREGDLPTNTAAAAIGGGVQAPPTVAVPADPNAAPMAPPSPTVSEALPAPAAMDPYPMCSAGQFDHCMEPGNGGGAGTHRTHRRRARR